MGKVILKCASKQFQIGYAKKQALLSSLLSQVSGKEPMRKIWAFKDITLEVNAGDFIGIIGSNGSGKTSLLRAIAGIYSIDAGQIQTKGKVISLINLHSGLKERLDAQDNIYFYGALYNLRMKTIKQRINSIIEFSGLKEFVNTKLYQFSSGMKQRLIFSVVIHSDPEILLLDEDFGMGDESFINKSFDSLKQLAKNGAIIFLISHNLDLIRKSCNRVVWLEQGRISMEGDVSNVINGYLSKRKEV